MPPCYEAVIRPNVLLRESNRISDETQDQIIHRLAPCSFKQVETLRPLADRELFMFRLQVAPLDEAMGCDGSIR